jgi:hypothetical protein
MLKAIRILNYTFAIAKIAKPESISVRNDVYHAIHLDLTQYVNPQELQGYL